MNQERYRYSSPHDWLSEAVEKGKVTRRELLSIIQEHVDADAIQDRFQKDMESDLYFEPIKDEENTPKEAD